MPDSEHRIGNPAQPHGEGGMFAAGKLQGTAPYAPHQAAIAAMDQTLPSWLTSPQKQAINAWLSRDQHEIHHAAINNDKGAWAGTIQNLDAAIAGSPVTKADQVVYRIFPDTEKWKAGMILKTAGFMAASPAPLAGAVAIHIPAGSQALELPGEWLLPRNTQLQVQAAVPGHSPQLTIYTGKTGDPPKVDPDSAGRQMVYYRALLLRTENEGERQAIMDAMKRISGDLRP